MAYQGHGTDISLVAGADLSAKQFHFVKPNSSGQAVAANATDITQVGVLQNDPTSGQTGTVRVAGVSKVKIAGTVAAGAEVTSDANGAGVAAATTKLVLGVALTGGVTGDVISVLVAVRGLKA